MRDVLPANTDTFNGASTSPDDIRPEFRELAQKYTTNAVRYFKDRGFDPSLQEYRLPFWSVTRDEAVKLCRSTPGGIVDAAELSRLGISCRVDCIKVGDATALAMWIAQQERANCMWGEPACCTDNSGVAELLTVLSSRRPADVGNFINTLYVSRQGGWYALSYQAPDELLKSPIDCWLYDPAGDFPPVPFGIRQGDFANKVTEKLSGCAGEPLVSLEYDAVESPDGAVFLPGGARFSSIEEWLGVARVDTTESQGLP